MSPSRLWVYRRLTGWLPESRGFRFKRALLRWAGAKVGDNVRIYSSVTILGTGTLEIGDDVHIGSGVFISAVAPAKVAIGSHVDIGPGAMILTGSHKVDFEGEHVAGEGTTASVEIGDGCWLGARSVILPGVKLPLKTLVAAGAVVTKSIDGEKHLIAGVPAVIKK